MKILLSAGHGGTDSGSIGADKGKEKDRTINLANKVASYLKNAGHSVTVNTEKTSSGAWRFKNRSGYDFALSIHFNAFDGTATGTECWYKSSQKKAGSLSSAVSNVLGIKNRGAKATTTLYMMNIGFDNLIEVCFHDNSSDLNKYNANIDKVAKAIADTINGSSTGNASSGNKKSNETIANEVIAGLWGNGSDRKNRLTNAGYNYNAIQTIVNQKLKGTSTTSSKKTDEQIAEEVIAGKWGNGQDRKNRLNSAGYDYQTVQNIVNQKLGATSSYYPKFTGSTTSIVDALKSIGIDSSFGNRKKIASKNGISNYSGTASQNTQLLNLLKQGKLKK